jgi:glycosyltransferase involved in cell wall biosynthesis
MKLAIACNHSFPHIGGSEKIVHQIAEHMTRLFDWDVCVFSRSIIKKIDHEKVRYIPCQKTPDGFISQLKKFGPDHTLVYSDCFNYWDDFLKNLEFISGTKSISLVGMNHMAGRRGSFKMFLSKARDGRIMTITHSDNYRDYIKCSTSGIDVNVIPNGVDISEFDSDEINFRDVYNLDNRNIILCVSNYFPGKGQEHLPRVLLGLKKRHDWQCIMISSSVNFMPSKILQKHVKRLMKPLGNNVKFIQDIPRSHIVAAFNSASMFVFPSQKEVAPLVLLEAQACRLSWIAMPVGNARLLNGGIILPSPGLNKLGFSSYSPETYRVFTNEIETLLDDPTRRKTLGSNGRNQIECEFNWSIIADQYNEVFSNAKK